MKRLEKHTKHVALDIPIAGVVVIKQSSCPPIACLLVTESDMCHYPVMGVKSMLPDSLLSSSMEYQCP